MKYEAPYGVSDPNAPYINGNPQTGQQGSIPPAAAIEYPQREIVGLITKSGFTPTDSDLLQLSEGVRSQFLNFASDIGTQNSLACMLDPPLLKYTVGLIIRIRVANTNSGSSTIDAGAGRVLIKRMDGLPLAQGDLPAGGIATLVFDGTSFQMANWMGAGGGGGGGPITFNALPYVVDTSTVANTINAPFSPAITTLTAGLSVLVKIANTNTGPTTININSFSNIPVRGSGHGALLPNDIAAGDVKMLVYDGSVFWLTPNFLSSAMGHGRCYLSLSGGNLLLAPRNGNGIVINGVLYPLPSIGVQLPPGGSPGVQYIYAFGSASGAVTLEGSSTAPTLNGDGVMIKSGDATRSLVGKSFLNTYGQWQDQDGFIGVLSWFNRRAKKSKTALTSNHFTSSGSLVEVGTEIRNYFLTWSDSIVRTSSSGDFYNVGGDVGYTNISFDGQTSESESASVGGGVGGANFDGTPIVVLGKAGLADNVLHYATLMGMTSNYRGTQWFGVGQRAVTLSIYVEG